MILPVWALERGGCGQICIDVRMLFSSGIGSYIRNLVPRVIRELPGWKFNLMGDREELTRWEGIDREKTVITDFREPIYSVREQIALAG